MKTRIKKNLILSDCEAEEIQTFADGFSVHSMNTVIMSSIANWGYNNVGKNIYRYLKYFIFPLKVLVVRKRYGIIIGWQQFYSIALAFWCKLFMVKKSNIIVVGNFTYKNKKGFIGGVYRSFMKYSTNNKYIDYFHVPSYSYAEICCVELGIPKEKFIITCFGIPDTSKKWENVTVPINDYVLSIGRSNRDFDFLVKLWTENTFSNDQLVLISDVYKPTMMLPTNITLINNIVGDAAVPWIKNCKMMIIPIDNGTICSGDTVLLSGMMFGKTVAVTCPSTLAEMYISHNVDGIHIMKNVTTASLVIRKLLDDDKHLNMLGIAARKKYLDSFSRFTMGKQLSFQIK